MQGISQLQQQSGAFPMTAPPLLSGMMDSFAYLDNRIQPAPGFGGFGAGIQSAATASALNQMTARAVSAPQCSTGHMGQFGNLQAGMNGAQSAGLNPAGFYRRTGMNTAPPPQQSISMNSATSQDMLVPSLNSTLRQNIARLPPMEETPTPHYSQRICMPFSTDEDANWLSEFQCMIRADILELFRVSEQGIKVRNGLKSLTVSQVGIRCRYCAHLQHGTRANRASCFPSKIDKIYQRYVIRYGYILEYIFLGGLNILNTVILTFCGLKLLVHLLFSFTMMLREHFPHCPEIPPPTKKAFLKLQNMNAQGASNAKGYWEHAAKKMGLVDITGENGKGGIHISEETQRHALRISPFGSSPNFREPHPPVSLVHKSDKDLASPFLYFLLQQVYRVHLAPSERKGNRKSLRPGMPGFGCKYCYEAGRMGLCRLFPARRRTIHTKIPDLYDHMKRCPLCPNDVKERLVYLHMEDPGTSLGGQDQNSTSRGREREFFEHVWSRLGHDVEAVEE